MKTKSHWQWYNPPAESLPVTYCLDSSLHGLKQLAQKQRHICERLFWLTAFIASVIMAIYLIRRMWKDYNDMPIVTVMNPREIKLEEIPFPSVTICNVNIIRKSTFQMEIDKPLESLDTAHILRSIELQLAMGSDTTYICDSASTFVDRFVENGLDLKLPTGLSEQLATSTGGIKQFINPSQTLRKLAQPCDQMILRCMWQDEVQNCSNLFRPIQTDHGHCCTFNTMTTSKLLNKEYTAAVKSDIPGNGSADTLDYESLLFTEATKDRNYPKRQRTAGKSSGLSFLVDPDLNDYFCTNTDSKGFRMAVKTPLDFPGMTGDVTAIPTNSEVFVGIRPEITMSDRSIMHFPPEKRQCYYGDELKLAHYTTYTISNCRSECIARKMLDGCGCVLYYMPSSRNDTLCKPNQYNCTRDVQKNVTKIGLTSVCTECLPTCTAIDYHEQVAALPLQRKKVGSLLQKIGNTLQRREVSIVHVYFNTDSVYPRLRKVVTTIPELLSNTGGLLGLCMGFSVLSLLEIVYYGTIRLCFRRLRNKAGQKFKREGDLNARSAQHGKNKRSMISLNSVNGPILKTMANRVFQIRGSKSAKEKHWANKDVFRISIKNV